MNLPLLSHAITAAAYAGVALLMLAGWQAHGAARKVALALAATAVWAIGPSLAASGVYLPPGIHGTLDAMRYAAWFIALLALAGAPGSGWLGKGALALCVTVLALMPLLPEAQVAKGAVIAGLALSMAGLVLIVLLVRAAPPPLRAALRLAAACVAGQFAFDLLLQVQAVWQGDGWAGIGAGTWAARGWVFTALLPLMVMAMHRAAAPGALVFVSRYMVFYAAAAIAIAGYLAMAALGGQALRAAGGSLGPELQLLFLGGAAVLLAALTLSKNLWRRLRVFIATHFYSDKYDYRLEWLRFIQTLSSADPRDAPRTAIMAVAQMFESPAGVLYAREEDSRDFSIAAVWPHPGFADSLPAAVPADSGLTQFLAERQWVIDVQEYRATPDVYGNLELPQWLAEPATFRLVTPLLHVDRLVGFMVLEPPPQPFRMTFEDRDLLKTVGRHIALQLTQQSADHKLTESRQFDAYNRFTAFVMHDLKNAVAQLQLLVQNAARHRDNPQFFDDAISTISNSVDRMTRLIGQLQARDVHGHLREIALGPVVAAAVARARGRQPAPVVDDPGIRWVVNADAEKLGAVLDHVIRNAQEATQDATGERGLVQVSMAADPAGVLITVRDDGPGMDAQFVRERLFRPFDSTKGSRGMGIGAYQTREYVRQLGGNVKVQSSPGQGTTFCITLPLCQRKNPDC